jgi:DNA transformation protein and related proteins
VDGGPLPRWGAVLALDCDMTASESFVELLEDALSGLGPVSVRRMFGGAGVYADGVMFGLIAGDTLYLKADDQSRHAFEAEGLEPFTYQARGKRRIAMSYWRIPERLLDDPDEMVDWARVALAVAKREGSARARSSGLRSDVRKRRGRA